MQAFHIIIKNGHEHTFRSIPIVTRTTRKFDAPRLVKAIVDYVEYRSFTCTDLKEHADEVTHHIKAEELRLAIGDMSALHRVYRRLGGGPGRGGINKIAGGWSRGPALSEGNRNG